MTLTLEELVRKACLERDIQYKAKEIEKLFNTMVHTVGETLLNIKNLKNYLDKAREEEIAEEYILTLSKIIKGFIAKMDSFVEIFKRNFLDYDRELEKSGPKITNEFSKLVCNYLAIRDTIKIYSENARMLKDLIRKSKTSWDNPKGTILKNVIYPFEKFIDYLYNFLLNYGERNLKKVFSLVEEISNNNTKKPDPPEEELCPVEYT